MRYGGVARPMSAASWVTSEAVEPARRTAAAGIRIDEEPGTTLLDQARELREDGWRQRIGGKYATYIAYETEAVELKNFEPMLVPGLLQTEAYAAERKHQELLSSAASARSR
jgi:hypothetical protein